MTEKEWEEMCEFLEPTEMDKAIIERALEREKMLNDYLDRVFGKESE